MKVLLCMLLALFYGIDMQAQENTTTEDKVRSWLKEKRTAFYASRANDPSVQSFLLNYDKLEKAGIICGTGDVQSLKVQAQRTNEETVLVNWQASTNKRVEGYILERSFGKDSQYEKISYMTAHNTDATQVFQYIDKNAFREKSFYRVVQVLALGKRIEKKAIAQGYDLSIMANAYPNPSSNHFTIAVQSKIDEPLQMRVVDVLGRVVEQRHKLQSNKLFEIGAQYRSGIYFVQISQGSNTKVVRLEKSDNQVP